MKNKIYLHLSTFFNFALKTKLSTWLSANLFLIPFYIMNYFIIGKEGIMAFIIFMQVLIIVIAISNVRLSEVIVYNRLFKIVSMSLSDINRYKEYDYDNELDKIKISKDFKEEFIKGLTNPNNKLKKISMTTHKWVVENVINSKEVQSLFDVDIRSLKEGYLTFDVLILSRKYTKRADIKRKKFKVKLTKKKSGL